MYQQAGDSKKKALQLSYDLLNIGAATFLYS